MNVRKLLLAILPLLLVGCASNSAMHATQTEENTPIAIVLADIDAHKGKQVRWGGTIASAKNKQGETWLEIVSRDLRASGKPTRSDKSAGRFIVKVAEFLEPEIYQQGRAVTVTGELVGSESGTIGEQSYVFPVVRSDKVRLWPKYQVNSRRMNWGWSYYGGHWGMHSRHFHPFFGPMHPYGWY